MVLLAGLRGPFVVATDPTMALVFIPKNVSLSFPDI